MKIGIDYQTVAGRGGNARYTRELAKALTEQCKDDIYIYNFLHDFRKRKTLVHRSAHIHQRFAYLTPPYAPRNIRWFNNILTRLMGRLDNLDIFHFTNPQNIVAGPYKSVVTIHDMSTYTDRTFAKAESHALLEQKLPLILYESSAIIAVSEYTKRDLVERFDVKEDKITVIYEAAGEEFYPDTDTCVCEKFGVSRFILYAGQLQPRKNIITLLEAFARVQKRHSDISLVLVGTCRDEEYKEKMDKTIKKYFLEDSVIFTGRVDDESLRKLYSTTECFVYPSLFEGFGLPPLEAMQCGAPVIVSNTSSLPEVVGDAGILINPEISLEIAEAINRVLNDSILRSKMHEASLNRAKIFSWQKAAQKTLNVYNNINHRSIMAEWGEYYKDEVSIGRFLGNIASHKELFEMMLTNSTPKKILEIGSGSGSMSTFLSWLGHDVLSIDNDLQVLEYARKFTQKMNASCRYKVADAFSLKQNLDEEFDIVFSQGFFEHFSDKEINVLLDQQLLVAPRVVFSVPSYYYGTRDYGNERLFRAEGWRRILSRYNVVSITSYNLRLRGVRGLVRDLITTPWRFLPWRQYSQILVEVQRSEI